MKFFINGGHCKDIINGVMADPGAVNNVYLLKEAEIADKIGRELKFYLEASGFEAEYLHSNNLRNNPYDDDLSYPCIVEEANKSNCDFAISIHLNAFNRLAKGTENIVFTRFSEAETMAGYIQASIVDTMGTVDRGIKYEIDKPSNKRLSFIVLTNMPAIIVECCFIDNDTDAQLLLSDDSVNSFAKAIFDGIMRYVENEV